MRTIEDILAALQAIVDAAEGRSFTDEEVTQYEALEQELEQTRRSNELRARNSAYNMPVGTHVHVGTPRHDDGLDRAFENYLRTGRENADIQQLRPVNAQGVGTDSAGGFLVSPEFRQKLVEVQKAYGGLAPAVDSFTTDRGGDVEFPSVDDTANQGTITAEGAAFSGGADVVFGTVTLKAWKYTSSGASNLPVKVSVELLQDSQFDVTGLLARLLGTRIARKQAVDWVTGAGTTLPFGLIHGGLTADVTVTGASGITYDALVDVETALDAAYEQNAQWLMRKGVWATIKKIKDTAGRPIIMEQAESGMGGRVARTLLGYPVILDAAAPDYVINTKFATLGDFRDAYVIRRVADLTVFVNPYSSAASGQVEYTAWERADGNIQNRKAYSILARGAT